MRLSGIKRLVFMTTVFSLGSVVWPAEVVLKTNPLVISFFRQNQLQVFLQLENKASQVLNITVEPVITDVKTETPIEARPSVSLLLAPNFSGEVSFIVPASGLKPWSHWDPQLYYLDLTLKTGSSVIKAERVRFGYREVWTEKGKIYING
ncbi:MAG: hypothetical protein NC823_01205, partial [Candidatus Omnitrophica bacterium]|nr:hypothetical protein [Candidatus Omnitrophota bacterium]